MAFAYKHNRRRSRIFWMNETFDFVFFALLTHSIESIRRRQICIFFISTFGHPHTSTGERDNEFFVCSSFIKSSRTSLSSLLCQRATSRRLTECGSRATHVIAKKGAADENHCQSEEKNNKWNRENGGTENSAANLLSGELHMNSIRQLLQPPIGNPLATIDGIRDGNACNQVQFSCALITVDRSAQRLKFIRVHVRRNECGASSAEKN